MCHAITPSCFHARHRPIAYSLSLPCRCVYRYYDEQLYFDTDLGYGDEHREYWVQVMQRQCSGNVTVM